MENSQIYNLMIDNKYVIVQSSANTTSDLF